MFSDDRRHFLRQAVNAGIAWSLTSIFGRSLLRGQTSPHTDDIARIYVDSRRLIAPLDRNLFGSFLEHLGRAIYQGIYDPTSHLSDANGFRKDVMEEVRQMGVPSRATTGLTALDPRKAAHGSSTRHGTRLIRISSAQMSLWPGARVWARSR